MTICKGMFLILLTTSLYSHAVLQPDRTRIVFDANNKATSLRVENRSDKLPYLAYSWIENEKGEKSDDLLVALPPFSVWSPKQLPRCVSLNKPQPRNFLLIGKRCFITIYEKSLPPPIKTMIMPFYRLPSRAELNCSGDLLHYVRKPAITSSNSYRLISRITN